MARRLLLVVMGFSVASACVLDLQGYEVTTREEWDFTTTGTADVDLSTFDGPVVVRGWDRPDVHIVAEKRAANDAALAAIDIEAVQSGNRIRVAAHRPRVRPRVTVSLGTNWRGASLVASVPYGTNVSVKTDDGPITVDNVMGNVTLHTDDGTINGRGLKGQLVASSDDGSVRILDAVGRVDARADDGSIEISGHLSRLRATSDDGSIRVDVGEQSVMDDDWRIETSDGSIVLELPRGFSGQLDAETDDGRVIIAENFGADASEGTQRSQRRVTVGEGGYTVRVRTDDGSVRIRDATPPSG